MAEWNGSKMQHFFKFIHCQSRLETDSLGINGKCKVLKNASHITNVLIIN